MIGRLQMRRQLLSSFSFLFPPDVGEDGRKESEYFTKETGQRYLKGQSVGEICSFSLSEERLAKPMGVMTID